MADNEVTFDSKQLDEMLAEVGKELIGMAKAEAVQALAKNAKDDAPAEESSGSSEPAAPAPEETPGEMAPEGDAPPPAEASAPALEASASPEASAPAGDPAAAGAEAPPSMEQLQQAYTQLAQQDPEALKMHFLACKAALAQVMGAGAGAPPPAPEASAPAMPPAAPPAAAPMAMAEASAHKVSASPANGGKMGKSEDQQKIAELEQKLAKQEESLGGLVNILTQPMRKSVKGVSDVAYIARTEEVAPQAAVTQLTKGQVQAKLREKIQEGKLTKSDKELVMKYNVGSVKVDKIEHLLKDAQ